jgi:acyl-CoA reductase-like NAD-dependent aldehyde dehydrogenase
MSRIRKPKASPPKDREAVMLQVRDLLAEHFDVGIAVVSWEDGGETYYMDFKYGNDYAARALCREADEILWPYEPDEDEEDDE